MDRKLYHDIKLELRTMRRAEHTLAYAVMQLVSFFKTEKSVIMSVAKTLNHRWNLR